MHTTTQPRVIKAKAKAKAAAAAPATAIQFRAISDQLARLRDKSKLLRDVLREAGPGRYEEATVYQVRSHQVRAHWREGWVAVRAKRRPI